MTLSMKNQIKRNGMDWNCRLENMKEFAANKCNAHGPQTEKQWTITPAKPDDMAKTENMQCKKNLSAMEKMQWSQKQKQARKETWKEKQWKGVNRKAMKEGMEKQKNRLQRKKQSNDEPGKNRWHGKQKEKGKAMRHPCNVLNIRIWKPRGDEKQFRNELKDTNAL